MVEKWKPIVDYEGLYEVSNLGQVRSIPRSRCKGGILKPHINKGYEYVHLCKNGKPYYAKVHRIVADAFLEVIPGKTHVNHIDGNKTNNHVSNLEWCTALENLKHAKENNLNMALVNNPYMSKPIKMILSGKVIKTFPSIIEASRQTNICRSAISEVALKKKGHHTAGGYAWEFV